MLLFKFYIGDQKVSLTEELKIIASVQVYHFTFIDNMLTVNKESIFKKYLTDILLAHW